MAHIGLFTLSRCGVSISPPKHPMSLKPRSSARTIRKLGRFFSAIEMSCVVSKI